MGVEQDDWQPNLKIAVVKTPDPVPFMTNNSKKLKDPGNVTSTLGKSQKSFIGPKFTTYFFFGNPVRFLVMQFILCQSASPGQYRFTVMTTSFRPGRFPPEKDERTMVSRVPRYLLKSAGTTLDNLV